VVIDRRLMEAELAGHLADVVFAPVRSYTAFEETVDRLGTAIKLGLLAPGSQLPAERELCARLGISRSTLREALTALSQSGHVFTTRGRSGGTFVCDPHPPAIPASALMLARWRETCDQRMAVELGVAVLAAERAEPANLDQLDEIAMVGDQATVVVTEPHEGLREVPLVKTGDGWLISKLILRVRKPIGG